MRKTLREKFDEKYTPEPNTGCWLWFGSTNESGYGVVEEGNKKVRAHRISWSIHRGDIPAGKLVCHHCDVRLCVNPEHLFLGTYADNSSDMVAKGRSGRGEKQRCARVTKAQVLEIRKVYEEGPCTQREVAARFGVSQMTISYIINRKTWKHV